MTVSVIIPTKNSEKTIGQCLTSLNRQERKNFDIEVLVIDSFSTDKTKQLAEELGAKVIQLESERTVAKNYGTTIANGEYVCFIDSDMILTPAVINECLDEITRGENIAGVIVPERSLGSGAWVRIRDFERSMYAGSKIESARFFKKKLVVEAGGFDEDIITYEESTLPQKLEKRGYRVDARTTSYIMHSEDGFNIKKWLRKKQYYAGTSQVYSQRYPEYAHLQLGVSYRLKVFLSHWKMLLRHPLQASGVFILKLLEYFYSRKAFQQRQI
jgi:glycosyltransferase involved in cell wall biosynthesis